MNVDIPCICPPDGTRHPEGDKVVLRDRLDFRQALALRNSVAVLFAEEPDAAFGEILATLTEGYLFTGIESWSVRGEDGKPLAPSKAAIRDHLLSKFEVAEAVGDKADELYNSAVMLPLIQKASRFSPPTPTDESTSPPTPSSTKPPKRSKPSSISTIPTVDTTATSSSLDGVSNLSPSSESAA